MKCGCKSRHLHSQRNQPFGSSQQQDRLLATPKQAGGCPERGGGGGGQGSLGRGPTQSTPQIISSQRWFISSYHWCSSRCVFFCSVWFKWVILGSCPTTEPCSGSSRWVYGWEPVPVTTALSPAPNDITGARWLHYFLSSGRKWRCVIHLNQ